MSENKQPEHQNTAHPRGQIYIPSQYYAPQDDEIDLLELFGVLWKGKWWIIGITALFTIATVFYALSLPNEYKATAIVAPASSDSGSNLGRMAGQLGGLASLAGINLGGGESNDAAIAMELMKTWSFQEEFIQKHNLEVPLFAAKGWSQAMNELIIDDELYDVSQKKWIRKAPKGKTVEPTSWELHEIMSKNLLITKDIDSGLISVSYTHYSPEYAQNITALLIESVNTVMKKKALTDAENNIDYLESQISLTSLFRMREVFYTLIEEQTKTMMMANVSDEYVFKEVSVAKIPEEKIGPRRSVICIISALISAILVSLFLLVRHIFFGEKEDAQFRKP